MGDTRCVRRHRARPLGRAGSKVGCAADGYGDCMDPLQVDILDAELPPTVAAPSIARRLVRSAGRDLSQRSLEDAQLLVSEMVSNVLASAGEPRPMQLRIQAHGVLSMAVEEVAVGVGEVSSATEPSPIERDAANVPPATPWGRDLVATVADAWGIGARDGRTSAWAELRPDR